MIGGGGTYDWYTQVRAGLVPGWSGVTVVGTSSSINSSTATTVWDEAILYVYPPSPVDMTVSSSSANDAPGMGGAEEVTISYLHGDHVEGFVTVVLDGQNPVNSGVADMFRINGMIVTKSDNSNTDLNQGIIYVGEGMVTAGKPTSVYGLIKVGDNFSQAAVYTSPANREVFIFSILESVAAGKTFLTNVTAKADGSPQINAGAITYFQNATTFPVRIGVPFAPKTDLRLDSILDSGPDGRADLFVELLQRTV